MTPSQYIANVGPLVTMRVPGKPPMLGATVVVSKSTASARSLARPFLTRARLKRGPGRKIKSEEQKITVPMFVMVTSVTIPKKWDVHGTVVKAAEGINKAYEENLEKYDGGA